jgi:hypothetical protein
MGSQGFWRRNQLGCSLCNRCGILCRKLTGTTVSGLSSTGTDAGKRSRIWQGSGFARLKNRVADIYPR